MRVPYFAQWLPNACPTEEGTSLPNEHEFPSGNPLEAIVPVQISP